MKNLYTVKLNKAQKKSFPANAELVSATFGQFKKEWNDVVYTATLCRDDKGELIHNPRSEFLDDMAAMESGNVEVLY